MNGYSNNICALLQRCALHPASNKGGGRKNNNGDNTMSGGGEEFHGVEQLGGRTVKPCRFQEGGRYNHSQN